MNKGILYALGAYVLWGFLPIYWKWLQHVPAHEVVSHRIGWSFIFLLIIITGTKKGLKFRSALTWRVLGFYSVSGIPLTVNWMVYIWAVHNDFIVETSLGYYINPLISVLLGMIFLGERLRPAQWYPLGLAALGVFYLTFAYGSFPWIALSLAFTFGFYGLVKKISPLGSLYGLTLETGIVFLPALGYLLYLNSLGQGAFNNVGLGSNTLLVGAGVVTSIPLLLFASAAKRISLTMIGLMQYIAPSIQLLIGVFIYNENFTGTKLIGFSMVWIALLIFWAEGVVARKRPRRADSTV